MPIYTVKIIKNYRFSITGFPLKNKPVTKNGLSIEKLLHQFAPDYFIPLRKLMSPTPWCWYLCSAFSL